MDEYRLVEVLAARAPLDPQLVAQSRAGAAVGLPAHRLARPLRYSASISWPCRRSRHGCAARELLKLGDQLAVAPSGEIGLDAQLKRRHPLLLQPG